MKESRLGQTGEFHFNPGHRPMSAEDAEVFERAALLLQWPELHAAIHDAGGDMACRYHFSREHCYGRPLTPWAGERDHATVSVALLETAERLRTVESA